MFAAAFALLFLSGCGNSRNPAPSTGRPLAPGGFRTLTFHGTGVRLSVPNTWTVIRDRPPLLATISSGQAVLAVWRYQRHARLPSTRRGLARARASLVAAVRMHQPAMRLLASKLVRLDGKPAIELDVVQVLGHALRRVLSAHVFAAHAELVIDEYAPLRFFVAVDRQVFTPVRRSLRIENPA